MGLFTMLLIGAAGLYCIEEGEEEEEDEEDE